MEYNITMLCLLYPYEWLFCVLMLFLSYLFFRFKSTASIKAGSCRNILINLSLSLTQLDFHIITINLKFQSEKKMLNTRSLMSLFYYWNLVSNLTQFWVEIIFKVIMRPLKGWSLRPGSYCSFDQVVQTFRSVVP